MSFQFHPLALGVILLVAAGTVVYSIFNSHNRRYSYDTPGTSRRSSRSDLYFISPDDSEDENEIQRRRGNCSICLRNLKGGRLKQLRCKHEFHENCINVWLNNHNTCPNCRKACA
ncbi:unnamed protein product [Callosobruchus maculatus]|uniref:RING-type domain-containing protein n=1 Tax=Callosobruchus maculatus TaxID=64391 RepID=A0A653BHM0_CALMS|nr:unnamed protein product [Callosobruchus maculatus]